MKLQFKEQGFQIEAVNAVVKCFEGQTIKTNRFTLEKSAEILRKAKEQASGVARIDYDVEELIGYRNSAIQITAEQIFQNIVAVQRNHYLIENQKLDLVKGVDIGYNLPLKWKRVQGKPTPISVRCMNSIKNMAGVNL